MIWSKLGPLLSTGTTYTLYGVGPAVSRLLNRLSDGEGLGVATPRLLSLRSSSTSSTATGAEIVRGRVALAVPVLPVPVTVRVELPTTVVASTVRVSWV